MVEVFKTDVNSQDHADRLIDEIRHTCLGYKANFDLEDCDRILRVKSSSGKVQASLFINLLKDSGFSAEVLPD